ncbi:MAG: hypothetical protein ACI915_002920 [Gammaproteobacteria bacterium]
MARLTLFVPGLFVDLLGFPDIDVHRWPLTALLVARSHCDTLEATSTESRVLELCGFEDLNSRSAAVAKLTSVIDFEGPPRDKLWRADPVHLRADPNQILLFNDQSIMPSVHEADELISALNAGLPEISLIRGRHPGRWYFVSNTKQTLSTCSPNAANGRSIADFLPCGPDAKALQRLMNEAQMILHSAPVNTLRQDRGVPIINSIWPWGGDELGSRASPTPDLLVGDDVLLAGIGESYGIDWLPMLAPDELTKRMMSEQICPLIVIGSPNGKIDMGTAPASLDHFESVWAGYVMRTLRRFKIRSVDIITDRERYSLSSWDMLKIWRRQAIPFEVPNE